jgi:threonine dehydrogenase-like Zn-dependent dehydrogenase
MARAQNAETVDFNAEDPVALVKELTGGIGVDRVIDAVGVDAQRPSSGPAADKTAGQEQQFAQERSDAAPDASPRGEQWVPGNAPSLAAQWEVEAVAKARTIGVIGVYPPGFSSFPFGAAMNKNLTVHLGSCNHRRYVPRLLSMVATGGLEPTAFITQHEVSVAAVEAYETFDRREEGWLKTVLDVA